MIMKFLFIFSLLACFFTPSFTQPYRIERIGIEQGLSNSYVTSIALDKDGLIWMATESGLNRFDGQEFKVYKKNRDSNETSISGNELNRVYADQNERIIWIATQRQGLNAFDYTTDTFKYYKHDPKDPNSIITNDITDVTNASDGNLWVSTFYRGVEYFDKKTGRFIHYNTSTLSQLVSDKVWTIKDDGKENLYIGHVDAGLSIMSLKDRSVKNFKFNSNDFNSLPGNSIKAICIDKNGNVWIGTNDGLALFNPDKQTFTIFKHIVGNPKSIISNYITTISQLDDDRIFVGTENGGISILDIRQNMFLSPGNISFSNIGSSDQYTGLSNPTIHSIIQDSYKNIWIATYGGGVNFISSLSPLFNVWAYSPLTSVKNRLNNKTAWGICVDRNDNVWIGTDGGGINYFEDGENKRIFSKESGDLSENAVLSAMCDSSGNLWFGTFSGGLNVYNSQTKQFNKKFIPELIDCDIRSLYEGHNKTIWIGSNLGIFSYNLVTKELSHYSKSNSKIPEDQVRAIGQDDEGNIWVGTFGQGMAVFNAKMELLQAFNIDNGFYSNMINHIFCDHDGRMWVGTGEGLILFPDSKNLSSYKIFTEDNGISDSFIRAITNDQFGNLWFSTNSGISQFAEDQDKFFNYINFEGLPLGSFMSGSVAKSSKGIIYFGSQSGVCYFNPKDVLNNISLSPVAVTRFKVYDARVEYQNAEKYLPVDETIELTYEQNTFNISFNTLNYAQNNMTEYAYMFTGFGDKWLSTQGEHSITFRNIPPGEYEFKVKSRIRNQEWLGNIATLKIVIHPPFWQSWWAKLIYAIIVCVIIFSIVKFYKRKLDLENSLLFEKNHHMQEQELNNERLRFYTNITHELRTPLTLILGPLDDLHKDTSLPEKQLSRIAIIRKSALRLLSLINQILEFRKAETQNKKLQVEKGDIVTLVQETGLKYKELNINKNILINVTTDVQNAIIYYDEDIINTILDNLISNAIKYTKKGTIDISLREYSENEKQYTEIEIADTGVGISEEELPKIFDRYYQVGDINQVSGTGIGLALVKNLVAIHQGTMSVESKVKKGTAFRFTILTNNTYPDAIHVQREEVASLEMNDEESNGVEAAKGSKQIVLVVEDNDDIRTYIKDALSDYYKVIATDDGAKGLDLALNHTPDLIISDIMMPVMDGIELCKRLKKDIRTSHIPVILLTAKDSINDRTEGYSIGADSYIVKPFNSSLLHSRITNLLESRKKTALLVNENTMKKNTVLTESISQLDQEFIDKATSIIEQDIDSEKIDVAFIADKMNMSHSTLYRKIKALTGMSANEYIRKIRIKNAERLLLTGKYTISEVSFMVGINSPTYFRQCFKDEFGLPPSEYLKHILSTGSTKEED